MFHFFIATISTSLCHLDWLFVTEDCNKKCLRVDSWRLKQTYLSMRKERSSCGKSCSLPRKDCTNNGTYLCELFLIQLSNWKLVISLESAFLFTFSVLSQISEQRVTFKKMSVLISLTILLTFNVCFSNRRGFVPTRHAVSPVLPGKMSLVYLWSLVPHTLCMLTI